MIVVSQVNELISIGSVDCKVWLLATRILHILLTYELKRCLLCWRAKRLLCQQDIDPTRRETAFQLGCGVLGGSKLFCIASYAKPLVFNQGDKSFRSFAVQFQGQAWESRWRSYSKSSFQFWYLCCVIRISAASIDWVLPLKVQPTLMYSLTGLPNTCIG